MRIALVTGAAGFVGAHLVEALKREGVWVRGFDLNPSQADESVVGDILDSALATEAAEGADTIFHLAGAAELWRRNPEDFDRINRQGTETMLAAAQAAGVDRFIHCSSLTTLVGRLTPRTPSRADESRRLEPGDMLGPYPRSKLLAERAVERAAAEGLDAVIAVPTEPLGPGDHGLTPPTRLIAGLLAGKIPATVDCILNFVPVESLARGFIAARRRGRRGERYLLGGRNVPMAELLEALSRLAGRPMPRARLPMALAYFAGLIDTGVVAPVTGRAPAAPLTGVRLAARKVSFASDKAERELGWQADAFEPALARAVAWLQSAGLAA